MPSARRLQRSGLACALSLFLALPAVATAAPRTGDPLLGKQWGLAQIDAPAAWRVATGKGVVVAVIDLGVDGTHPDLRGRVLPGLDLVNNAKNAWADTDGHGTGVAGVVAAARGNGKGIVGVAPDARILPVKIGDFQPDNNLTPRALRWAAAHGARVIVLSIETLAGVDVVAPAVLEAEVQEALDEVWAKGVVVVVAAGNNSEPICSAPASLRHAVCVGAVDKRRLKPAFSSFDAAMGHDYLVAPGGSDNPLGTDGVEEHIWTTAVPGAGTVVTQDYWVQMRGTSFASPFVAGVAALLVQRGLTNAQIVQRLEATATDLGTPGRDPVYGYGEVNAARALGVAP